jgi:hypothetical protein
VASSDHLLKALAVVHREVELVGERLRRVVHRRMPCQTPPRAGGTASGQRDCRHSPQGSLVKSRSGLWRSRRRVKGLSPFIYHYRYGCQVRCNLRTVPDSRGNWL